MATVVRTAGVKRTKPSQAARADTQSKPPAVSSVVGSVLDPRARQPGHVGRGTRATMGAAGQFGAAARLSGNGSRLCSRPCPWLPPVLFISSGNRIRSWRSRRRDRALRSYGYVWGGVVRLRAGRPYPGISNVRQLLQVFPKPSLHLCPHFRCVHVAEPGIDGVFEPRFRGVAVPGVHLADDFAEFLNAGDG
jgi:hypothetical protein